MWRSPETPTPASRFASWTYEEELKPARLMMIVRMTMVTVNNDDDEDAGRSAKATKLEQK